MAAVCRAGGPRDVTPNTFWANGVRAVVRTSHRWGAYSRGAAYLLK